MSQPLPAERPGPQSSAQITFGGFTLRLAGGSSHSSPRPARCHVTCRSGSASDRGDAGGHSTRCPHSLIGACPFRGSLAAIAWRRTALLPYRPDNHPDRGGRCVAPSPFATAAGRTSLPGHQAPGPNGRHAVLSVLRSAAGSASLQCASLPRLAGRSAGGRMGLWLGCSGEERKFRAETKFEQ